MSRPRNPHRAAIEAGLLADESLKTIAVSIGLSITCLSKWAASLGYRRMFVTTEERRHLMARRSLARQRAA